LPSQPSGRGSLTCLRVRLRAGFRSADTLSRERDTRIRKPLTRVRKWRCLRPNSRAERHTHQPYVFCALYRSRVRSCDWGGRSHTSFSQCCKSLTQNSRPPTCSGLGPPREPEAPPHRAAKSMGVLAANSSTLPLPRAPHPRPLRGNVGPRRDASPPRPAGRQLPRFPDRHAPPAAPGARPMASSPPTGGFSL